MRLQPWEVFPDHSESSNGNRQQPATFIEFTIATRVPVFRKRLRHNPRLVFPISIRCVKLREPGIRFNTTNIAEDPRASQRTPDLKSYANFPKHPLTIRIGGIL